MDGAGDDGLPDVRGDPVTAAPTERGVLAVLDREIARWSNLEAYSEGRELIEARAAVAELIQKARAVTATGDERTLVFAIDDLRAALARAERVS